MKHVPDYTYGAQPQYWILFFFGLIVGAIIAWILTLSSIANDEHRTTVCAAEEERWYEAWRRCVGNEDKSYPEIKP